ncbi:MULTISPECIES: hypothetical protein [Streptomyces]|uniref:Uncharacterized protein n=1 Tax=Streptomyces lonarensis TaxID=700599 RepID=A0A7X6HYB2_9ACTN|nr:hypothetical protein [Streptomyces lonarensis]NJQ05411.1 hypothetical protein [Streptomyces lonarensis]
MEILAAALLVVSGCGFILFRRRFAAGIMVTMREGFGSSSKFWRFAALFTAVITGALMVLAGVYFLYYLLFG